MGECQEDLIVTTIRNAPGVITVRVIGELDIRTAPVLVKAVTDAAGERRDHLVRLDLAGVSFCDHAALRALHAAGVAAGPERVRIVATHHAVDMLLRLCGISTFLGHPAGATFCPN
ncbi:STAS domain-containing protein [Actinoplanes derwentensis]|uniref:Anti-anti-sigma factor n=1 Tax=Actinoplanes derwentensis TaxID=113562 RepID=A0A1H2AWR2_9ACTN|nr:STAS domain-containing protein [Actinoplanes derwentensis]SDT49936.1 anti-anti-sigma factor [Actinoplanes derwentensis]